MNIENPYADLKGGQWLRGNLHSHTTRSDGQRSPQEVIDDYARRGYKFLMLSDHDVLTSIEDLRDLDAKGMVLIPGNEITGDGPDLLHVNARRKISPVGQRQQMIQDATASGGFIVVCHPNCYNQFDQCTIHQLHEWYGYAGIEIYNGVIGRLDGSPYATNKWDMVLNRRRRVWGFANDDSHAARDVAQGWNHAYVHEPSLAGVTEALATGRFYPSTGVTIANIRVEGTRITIETENAQRIVALKQIGNRIAVADQRSIEVEVPPDAVYVRFECWGSGEQFAWTQPFFVSRD